ncbi:MAG: phosphotransacetylase family protein [Anaerolineae bacterium]|nr:phosphotransacetylase family protein [Anaerolineae bacterium]
MKTLCITSIETFSGKTAVCLALGRKLQRDGYQVGYLKTLSTQQWEPVPGRTVDEDADFICRTLGLEGPSASLVGVVLTKALLKEALCQRSSRDLLAEVQTAYRRAAAGKDVLLMEGGASLREGVSVGLGVDQVAQALDVPVLAVVRFRNEMDLLDSCLVAKMRLGERLRGVVVNAVPEQAHAFVKEVCCSCLEDHGIAVFGVLPRRDELAAISVGEMAQVLEAEFLALPEKQDVLVQNLVVGAMSVEQALPRMRRIPGTKAIITGGDRADMQLAALETATHCLVLTGHLRPQPEVLRRAEELGVPVLLVRQNTMETVEAIEDVFGKTRLGQREKLERFEALMAEHFDLGRLYQELGLEKRNT